MNFIIYSKHTHPHIHTLIHLSTYSHTHTYTLIHTRSFTYLHTHPHTHTHTHTHNHTFTHTVKYSSTYSHTYSNTYSHTHLHTHTPLSTTGLWTIMSYIHRVRPTPITMRSTQFLSGWGGRSGWARWVKQARSSKWSGFPDREWHWNSGLKQ